MLTRSVLSLPKATLTRSIHNPFTSAVSCVMWPGSACCMQDCRLCRLADAVAGSRFGVGAEAACVQPPRCIFSFEPQLTSFKGGYPSPMALAGASSTAVG